MISVSEFKERRNKLFEQIQDDSIVILFSGVPKKRSEDEDYEFLINRNFYYLTNIEQENSILLLLKNGGAYKEYLFVNENDPVKEKWYGKRLSLDEAKELSGVENLLYVDSFNSRLSLILDDNENATSSINNIYLDFDSEQKVGDGLFIENYIEGLKANYSNKNFINVYALLAKLRLIKSKQEIEEFKEAISKTNLGIRAIMKNVRPGMHEYQMSSLFYYTIQDFDHSELSFNTICASGVNATCLHYPNPKGLIHENDLLLLDLGSKNNGYCADISRTLPVSGKFTELQKKIYSIVLECNKMIITKVKPGISLKELNDYAKEFLAEECLKAKLINSKDEISKYYFHSVSHYIGLDTHDICISRTVPLEAGNIISDEPGLYFKEYGIGVRIEDDILVTEEGSYNLSGNIIKEISDIEKMMLFRK